MSFCKQDGIVLLILYYNIVYFIIAHCEICRFGITYVCRVLLFNAINYIFRASARTIML